MDSNKEIEYGNLSGALITINELGKNKHSLIKRRDWANYDFESVTDEIDTIVAVAKCLQELPAEHLPTQTLRDLASSANQCGVALTNADNFEVVGNPDRSHQQIIEGLKRAAEDMVLKAMAAIPYIAFLHGAGDKLLAALRGQLDAAQQDIKMGIEGIITLREKAEEHARGAETAEANANKVAAAVAAAQFSDSFSKEANALKTAARQWLAVTGLLAVVTVVAAFSFMDSVGIAERTLSAAQTTSQPDPIMRWDVLSNMVNRATILAVLFTGTLWCGRIYRSVAHQATTNQHRALTLDTFKAFVNASEDPHVKDSILLAAARTIFGRAPTGLVTGESGKEADVSLAIGQQPAAGAGIKAEE